MTQSLTHSLSRMRFPPRLPLAILVAAISAPLAAQGPSSWRPEETARLQAVLDSAVASSLPVSPLRFKVAEGNVKGAAPERVIVVVRSLADAMREARTILGREESETELVSAAAAIQSGVSVETLRSLFGSLRIRSASTQVFVAMTDLTQRGVPVSEGASTLMQLARAGAGAPAFEQLRSEIASDVSTGLAARTAVRRRADDYLSRGFTPQGSVFRSPSP